MSVAIEGARSEAKRVCAAKEGRNRDSMRDTANGQK
jgi:hypothetical protein